MPASTTVVNQSKIIYPQGINLTSATLKCALFTAAVGGLSASATLYSGLTGEVASGAGYTTGGNTLSGMSWSGTTTPQITGTIPSWTSATITFRYAVIYDTGTGKIISYTDFGSNQTVTAGTLTLSFDVTNGYIQVSST